MFPSIVPPYILERIAQNGTPEQRVVAARALADDYHMRDLRGVQLAAQFNNHAPAPAPASEAASVPQKTRSVHTNEPKGFVGLPGPVLREEGQSPTGDAAADSVYDILGETFDFYRDVFGRNSIDNQGMKLVATVHYGVAFKNAFWNGNQMVLGDGDGAIFTPLGFTSARDIIGHEFTHGVIQYSAQLQYSNQAGALNESVCDVVGSLVKQWKLGQTVDQADWLIGESVFAAGINGVALRSMKAPGTAFDDPVIGKDPQPAHWDQYVKTEEDNGGVHIFSGIANLAFYRAAAALGGYAWDKAGRIWYNTITGPSMYRHIGFIRFGQATIRTAADLYGHDSLERKAVEEAWKQVGVEV